MPVLLNKRIWILLGEYGVVRVLSCFDMDSIRSLIALAKCYKVNFDAKGGMWCFLYSCRDSFVSRVLAYDGIDRGSAFNQVEIRVRYWSYYVAEGMRLDLADLAVRHFKDGSPDIRNSQYRRSEYLCFDGGS